MNTLKNLPNNKDNKCIKPACEEKRISGLTLCQKHKDLIPRCPACNSPNLFCDCCIGSY